MKKILSTILSVGFIILSISNNNNPNNSKPHKVQAFKDEENSKISRIEFFLENLNKEETILLIKSYLNEDLKEDLSLEFLEYCLCILADLEQDPKFLNLNENKLAEFIKILNIKNFYESEKDQIKLFKNLEQELKNLKLLPHTYKEELFTLPHNEKLFSPCNNVISEK